MTFLHDMFSVSFNVLAGIRLLDLIDIAIVAFCIYKLMMFVSRTRAMQLIKGLFVLFGALAVAYVLNLYTVYFILSNGLRYGMMAIFVIFYPELRRVLEYLGRSKVFMPGKFMKTDKENAKAAISEISKAISYFSANKVGALIVVEQEIALGDIAETGTVVDSRISFPLLETIFYVGSSLHDGAVIIRQDRVHAAGCVLPLTGNKELEQTLGTRHRAGIGITEVSDAITLIVSEETGIISMAHEGHLSRFLDIKSVEKTLYNAYLGVMEGSRSDGTLRNLFKKNVRRKNG